MPKLRTLGSIGAKWTSGAQMRVPPGGPEIREENKRERAEGPQLSGNYKF